MDYISYGSTFVVQSQMACWTQQNNHCYITYAIEMLLLLKQQLLDVCKSEGWHSVRRRKMISNPLVYPVVRSDWTFSLCISLLLAWILPPPSQRSEDPATLPLCDWSPPCSWAPWCHQWHRVWRSDQNHTPSLPASSHQALHRGPKEGDQQRSDTRRGTLHAYICIIQ